MGTPTLLEDIFSNGLGYELVTHLSGPALSNTVYIVEMRTGKTVDDHGENTRKQSYGKVWKTIFEIFYDIRSLRARKRRNGLQTLHTRPFGEYLRSRLSLTDWPGPALPKFCYCTKSAKRRVS